MIWVKNSNSLFCTLVSSCPNTICSKDYTFPLSGVGSQKSIDHKWEDWFLRSWFYFIHLYICPYASATLSDYSSFVVGFEMWSVEVNKTSNWKQLKLCKALYCLHLIANLPNVVCSQLDLNLNKVIRNPGFYYTFFFQSLLSTHVLLVTR